MSGIPVTSTSVPLKVAANNASDEDLRQSESANKTSERSPEQKARDEVYKAIRAGHRFDCFAPERNGNTAKWYIDGRDFMWAISEIIDGAKRQICLLDWWLSPELYLRRPPEQFQDWRLDRLLLKKALQGVKVHIIVYQEVAGTSPLDSEHTEHALENLHPNIAVMRHPDHNPLLPANPFFWSHHEKVALVDNTYASMGGLDLCFGRWDTPNHPLADAHPSSFDKTLFSGQDYNNSRILDFQSVKNFVFNRLSTLETGRMPWHDVSLIFTGPSVLDAVQHFVERWNFIKAKKYATNPRYDWLPLPQTVNSPSQFRYFGSNAQRFFDTHPMWTYWQARGKQYLDGVRGIIRHFRQESTTQSSGNKNLDSKCKIQVCRSASNWSHDVPTEKSIQNAYISMIKEAKHFIYIENQFFISSTSTGGPIVNQIATAITERIIRAAKAGDKFKVMVMMPEVPAFPGKIKDVETVKIIMGAQWRTINRGGTSIIERVREAGYDPAEYIAFYHVRSYDRINGAASVIERLAAQSNISYDEALGALARIWLGDGRDPKEAEEVDDDIKYEEVLISDACAPVQVQHPQTLNPKPVHTVPGSGAGIGIGVPSGTDDETGHGTKAELPIPPTVAAAKEILHRFQSASTPADKAISDSVAGHALQDDIGLESETWAGMEEEKKSCYVTELTYIHSKVMIVDDLRVVIGSANLNDRSMKGDGDSEIAVVVEDADMIASRMNGQPYQATRFAATLRRQLFNGQPCFFLVRRQSWKTQIHMLEHLGLIKPQNVYPSSDTNGDSHMTPVPNAPEDTTQSLEDVQVEDPLSDQLQTLWNQTARKNTEIFLKLFKTVPNNVVRNWKDYDTYLPDVRLGHVAADLPPAQITQLLSQVRGHVVQAAMDFLIEEEGLVSGIFWSTLNPLLPIWV